jgi:hypothetical protein
MTGMARCDVGGPLVKVQMDQICQGRGCPLVDADHPHYDAWLGQTPDLLKANKKKSMGIPGEEKELWTIPHTGDCALPDTALSARYGQHFVDIRYWSLRYWSTSRKSGLVYFW